MPERRGAEADRMDRDHPDKNKDDRRRSPRFNCAGLAKISNLPSNGIFLPGSVRDLSLSGCAIDTPMAIEFGTRAELVVHVNSSSFRVVGEVRQIRGRSGAGFEFVQLSAAGKDCLANMIDDLARLQAAINKMRSPRPDVDLESLRNGAGGAEFLGVMFRKSFAFPVLNPPAIGVNGSGSEVGTFASAAQKKDEIAKLQPLVISVDLFV
jgi:hypothetical protein